MLRPMAQKNFLKQKIELLISILRKMEDLDMGIIGEWK